MRMLSMDRVFTALPARAALQIAALLLSCLVLVPAASAATGMALEVAPWVPPPDEIYGGWTAVPAGQPLPDRPEWSKAGATLALEPGDYDVYWSQDYDTRDSPMLLATGIAVSAGQVSVVAADGGVGLAVAAWVPPRDETYGYWSAVAAGAPPDERVNWTKSAAALLLPAGRYDLYWVQDYDNRDRPLLLAAGVAVTAHERTMVAADSGIGLEVADWVPRRDETYGWWAVTRSGEPPEKRLHWTKSDERLLLPPGTYDVYWVQDYETRSAPLLLAASVAVAAGELATVPADSGVRLALAPWVPPRDETYGWWGAVRGGDSPHNRVNWTNAADALLLPPGTYDIYWVQHYDMRSRPLALGPVLVQPGEFGGVGLELSVSVAGVAVVRTVPGGAAEQGGLRMGDIVLAVDGEALQGKSLGQAVDRLRGPPGSSVTLRIARPQVAQPFDVVLERKVVIVPPSVVTLDSGIVPVLAPGAPALAEGGWWGASPAGAGADARVNWAETTGPLVLPPGRYDVWWQPDGAQPPALQAGAVEVAAGKLVEVPIAPPATGSSEPGASDAWALVQTVTAGAADIADDFSNPASGWTVVQTATSRVGYVDDTYRIALTTRGSLLQLALAPIEVGDGIVQVDAADASAGYVHPYGLLVRVQDDRNLHLFIVAEDESFALLHKQNDRPAMDATGVLPAGVYRRGEVNRLQALLLGDTLVFFVNGVEAARGLALWQSGTVGLLSVNPGAGTSQVIFDDWQAWLAKQD